MNTLLDFGELLKEPINQMISRVWHVLGFTSVLTSGAIAATEQQVIIHQGYGITEWAAVAAMVVSLLYIPYLLLLIAIKYREFRQGK